MQVNFKKLQSAVTKTRNVLAIGRVTRIIGLVIEGDGPDVPLGSMVRIIPHNKGFRIRAEVVGFKDGRVLMMPLSAVTGIAPNSRIEAIPGDPVVRVDKSLLGRILDGMGNPIDDKGPLLCEEEMPIYAEPINPVKRTRISKPLDLGVRAVNSLLTCGRGQRIGILSGTGVGKSVLLGMMAKYTKADVTVIGFIGERGRELNEFIGKNLGEEGLKRSVIVTATSDNMPLVRLRAAYTATAIAEYFRKQGKDVLLVIDSLTRFAMAQREIGLSIGEPPATKGYTPSVFALLPKLLERAGTGAEGEGSITGLYTILVEGDDITEPISDASRAILDGHIILSRQLAAKGHYPAIDPLNSISRVMIDITSERHMEAVTKFKKTLAVYNDAEDLINIGAYVQGSNPDVDYAIGKIAAMRKFLTQGINENCDMETSLKQLEEIF